MEQKFLQIKPEDGEIVNFHINFKEMTKYNGLEIDKPFEEKVSHESLLVMEKIFSKHGNDFDAITFAKPIKSCDLIDNMD